MYVFPLCLSLYVEACTYVSAYGCLLFASRNPMQCQIPVIPQAQCWISTVNIIIYITFSLFIQLYIQFMLALRYL